MAIVKKRWCREPRELQPCEHAPPVPEPLLPPPSKEPTGLARRGPLKGVAILMAIAMAAAGSAAAVVDGDEERPKYKGP